MSDAVLAFVAFVAAVNPAAQLARPQPAADEARLDPLRAAAAAAVVGALMLLVRVPFLDVLDISGSSFQLAAGFVLIAAGVPVLLFGRAQALDLATPDVEAGAARSQAEALAWYALNPALLAALVTFPDRSNLAVTIAAFAVALIAGAAASTLRQQRGAPLRLAASAARVVALLLLAAGVALAVGGVRAI